MTTTIPAETSPTVQPPPTRPRITLGTLASYLAGRRTAILQIANSRQALWLGLLFVLSAGFAREYDGEDLLHEPWHLIIPLGASLGTSFLLFTLVFLNLSGARGLGFRSEYRRFLTLYWMTAPLAWLYAIPFEQFSEPVFAVSANLYLLGIVAVWRVLLMIRVISVLYSAFIWHAFLLVMLFADVVAVTAIAIVPRPILDVMGGIRQTESEKLILNITCFIQGWGIVLFPFFLIAAIICWAQTRKRLQIGPVSPGAFSVSPSAWLLATVSILGWFVVLPWTQEEQQHRWYVTKEMRAGRIENALQYMSRHQRDGFPPHWDPPPRPGYGERVPPFYAVIDALEQTQTADWVRDIYLNKLIAQARHKSDLGYARTLLDLSSFTDPELRRYVNLLKRMPEGAMIAASHSDELYELLRTPKPDDYHPPPELTAERRQLLLEVNQLARSHNPKAGVDPNPPDEAPAEPEPQP